MTDTYTLLYDGTCRICIAQMQWVARYDTQQRIVLADINDPAQRARFPSITPEAAQREIHLVAPDGTIYRGVEAVRQTLLLLPALYSLGTLMSMPGMMTLARPLYAWVARNRYALGGRVVACEGDTCAPAATAPVQDEVMPPKHSG